jgi:hypothetical protein
MQHCIGFCKRTADARSPRRLVELQRASIPWGAAPGGIYAKKLTPADAGFRLRTISASRPKNAVACSSDTEAAVYDGFFMTTVCVNSGQAARMLFRNALT